jgi:hypothetical protein
MPARPSGRIVQMSPAGDPPTTRYQYNPVWGALIDQFWIR